MIIIQILFCLFVFLILYSYLFYPVLLMILSKFWKKTKPNFTDVLPAVSMIISAYNEEKVIQAKIDNCLALDYPSDRLEIIFASDGSDDRTNGIVRKFCGRGIVLYDYKQRRGKVNVLNETIGRAQNDIIIFSDANTMFEPAAIKNLVRHFQNPNVGCVCGALEFKSADKSKTGELEGVYWRYETLLKNLEGSRGCLLGANGGIYALRKELFFRCPADTIVEDFIIPMKILQQGYKVIFETQARAVEEAAQHIVQEKKRRIRIGAGDFQALFMLLPMLSPLKGFSALAFWSHKVLRWFAPFFLIGAFIANLALLAYPLFQFTFSVQTLFYVSAMIGQILSWSGVHNKFFNLCYYFVSMNLALLLGFFRFLAGTQRVTWERTGR